VLIHRQQFDSVYEKGIILITTIFVCDMSAKFVMEKKRVPKDL